MDEADIGSVQVGDPVAMTFSAFPNNVYVGTVTSLPTTATTSSNVTTYAITVSLASDTKGLTPGMTANLTIVTSNLQNVITVPNLAVTTSTFGSYVTTLDSQDKEVLADAGADRRKLDIRSTQIISGLTAGQRIVESLTGGAAAGGAGRARGGFGGLGGGLRRRAGWRRLRRRTRGRMMEQTLQRPLSTVKGHEGETHSLIEMRHVAKTYVMGEQEVHALRDVSLRIDWGEFVAIMGSSGSGKSTLMNILGCLDRPSSGNYLLEGRDVAKFGEDEQAIVRNRTLGFVFQSFNLLSPHLGAQERGVAADLSGVSARSALTVPEQPWKRWDWAIASTTSPASFPGVSSSAWRSPGRLSPIPRWCWPTNRPGTWTPRSAPRSWRFSRGSTPEGLTIVLVTHEDDIAAHAKRVLRVRDGLVLSDHRQDPLPAGSVGERSAR